MAPGPEVRLWLLRSDMLLSRIGNKARALLSRTLRSPCRNASRRELQNPVAAGGTVEGTTSKIRGPR